MTKEDLLREIRANLVYNEAAGAFSRVGKNGVPDGMKIGGAKGGTVQIMLNGARHEGAKLAWLLTYGELPKGKLRCLDGDRANLRASNLVDTGEAIYGPKRPKTHAKWVDCDRHGRRLTPLGHCSQCKASAKKKPPERRKLEAERLRKKYHASEAHRLKQQERYREWSNATKGRPINVLRALTRQMIHRMKTGAPGFRRHEEILGYTREQLRAHLEAQFEPWMSWENHGEWHVDHIYPVAAFVRDGVTDPKVVHALSNLRPLSAEENIRKSDKVEAA